MQCRKCGAEINTELCRPDGTLICPGCKTLYRRKSAQQQPVPPAPKATEKPEPAAPKVTETPVRRCAGCGAPLPEIAAFCPECGTPAQKQVEKDATDQRQAKKAQSAAKSEEVEKKPRRKKRGALTVALVLLAVLLLAGGGLLLASKAAENKMTVGELIEGKISRPSDGLSLSAAAPEESETKREPTPIEALFKNGPIMACADNGLWGYLDSNEQWVLEPQFRRSGYGYYYSDSKAPIAAPFRNGLALVQDSESDAAGVIDKSGNWVIEPCFKNIETSPSDGLLLAQDSATGNWGVVDEKYQWVIRPQFEKILNFQDGLAGAKDPNSGKWGYIDQQGNWVIQPQFGYVRSFCSGFAAVRDADKHDDRGDSFLWGIIDKSGRQIVQMRYGDAYAFNEGLAPVQDAYTKKWGYVNESGELVIPCSYYKVSSFSNGRALVTDIPDLYDEYTGMIDKENRRYINYPASYHPTGMYTRDGLLEAARWVDGYMVLSGSDSDCVIDTGGNIVLRRAGNTHPIIRLTDISGLFTVREDSLYGVIDKNNNWVIEPRYSNIIKYNDTQFLASDAFSKYIFDSSGTLVKETRLSPPRLALSRKSIDGKTKIGFVDADGNLVIDYLFESCEGTPSSFYQYAIVAKDGLAGVIDPDGNWLIQPRYKEISC